MRDAPLIRFRAFQFWFGVVAALVLSACSMQISEPQANSIVDSPTKVVVTANASFTLTKFTIDGTDFTNQMNFNSSTGNYEGNLNLTPTTHTAVATADVYCGYCTGQKGQMTDTKTFSVCAGGPAPPMQMTTFEQGGAMQSWSDDGTLKVEADSGTSMTRWVFARLAGIGSPYGMIRSVKSACACVRSSDDNQGTQLALSFCDANDWRQHWRSLRWTMSNGRGFYDFANRQNNDCITDAGGQLVQKDCNQTSDQLWSVRDNMMNTFITDTAPWP